MKPDPSPHFRLGKTKFCILVNLGGPINSPPLVQVGFDTSKIFFFSQPWTSFFLACFHVSVSKFFKNKQHSMNNHVVHLTFCLSQTACILHFYTFRPMFRATKSLLRNLSTFKNAFAFFFKELFILGFVLNFISSALLVTDKKLVFL